MSQVSELPSRGTAERGEQSLEEELHEEMFSGATPEGAEEESSRNEGDESIIDPEPVAEHEPAHTVVAPEPVAPEATATATAVAQRAELEQRISASRHLPPGLRRQLSQSVGQAQWDAAGEEQPVLSVSQALSMLEESLPRQFTLQAAALESSGHPAGESFFSGQAEPLNEQQAAQLAAEQLTATGFATTR